MCSAARPTAATLIALWTLPAYAMDAGAGTLTCFQFATAYGENQAAEHRFFAWAQGYMSGLSSSRTDKANIDLEPDSFDEVDQLDFLLSYCAANPSRTYASGVERLYERIQRVQQSVSSRKR